MTQPKLLPSSLIAPSRFFRGPNNIFHNLRIRPLRWKIWMIGVVLVFFNNKMQAQTLNLRDAINVALKNSLDIQLQKNNLEISRINNYVGVAGGLPTVTAAASDQEQLINVNQKLNTGTEIKRAAAPANNVSANVTIGMLLYNGSRVVATRKRLDQLESQSEKYLNSQVQNVMAEVMTAYYDVIRQQAYVRTFDTSIAVAQKRLDIVKARQAVGMANNSDLFQSQLDLNNLVQLRQSQLLVVEQSKTSLLSLLTLRPDSVIAVEDTIIVDRTITLGDILGSIHQNADIMAANDQIRINQQIVKETGAQRYPTLRANGSYNFNRNQVAAGNVLLNRSYGPSAGITLGIPIYNGSIYKRQQQVAEVNVKNADLQREILVRDYTANAVRTFQAYSSNLEQLGTARSNLELAKKLLDLALMRYQYSQATILEVRQAQESFTNTAFALINIAYAAKSSEIELQRLVNQIKF